MAENKQLTVAELLARAQKENPQGAEKTPRKRRRRSIEDGGISVAELTGSFKAVTAAPTESRHSSVPLDAPAAEKPATSKPAASEPAPEEKKPTLSSKVQERQGPKATEPKSEDKKPADKQQTAAEKKAEEKAAKAKAAAEQEAADKAHLAKARAAKEAAAASDNDATKTPSDDDTGVIKQVSEDPAQNADSVSETGEMPKVAEEKAPAQTADQSNDLDDEDDDSGMSAGPVILLAILGILGGIAIFLGFQYLWSTLNPWIVVVAALVVTGAMIAAVKWLRTASDGLSMTLAGLVGLVITFGPATLVLF